MLKTQNNVFNIFVFDLGTFKLKDKNVEDIRPTALSKVGHVHFSGQKVAAWQKQGQG